MDPVNPALNTYQEILQEAAKLTSGIKHVTTLLDRKNVDQTIQELTNARDLICQLCDEQGSIKQEVAKTITDSIRPDIGDQLSEMDEMQKGLSCLSSIFSTIHHIALIDGILDRAAPRSFSRDKTKDAQGGREKLNDAIDTFLDSTLIRGSAKMLSRRVLADIMHDMIWLLNNILAEIAKNPVWGEKDPEKMRLDKFCDQTGKYFMNCSTVRMGLDPRKTTKVNLHASTNPEHQHFSDFAEIIAEQTRRFNYLFNR